MTPEWVATDARHWVVYISTDFERMTMTNNNELTEWQEETYASNDRDLRVTGGSQTILRKIHIPCKTNPFRRFYEAI